MQRRMTLWMLIWTVACSMASAALSQEAADARKAPTGSVTIFTDGLADPNGRTSRVLREMAIAVDESKVSRPMLVMGYGGVGNVRDLLQSRGVDFAILNSDIFAYLDLVKTHPEARKKLRLVTELFQQRVFLAAQDGISSIDQLKGKKIAVLGAESAAGVTARTIFGLARVPVTFVRADEQAGLESDGVLFLEDDAPRYLARLAASGRYKLIPVAPGGGLAGTYRQASISAAEAPGLVEWSDVATLRVDTVLAVFDWPPGQARYIDVTRFIDGLFNALPRLKQRFPGSVWDTLNLQASIPGWRRYAYAEGAAKAIAAAAPQTPPAPPAQPVSSLPQLAVASQQSAALSPQPAAPDAAAGEPLRLALSEAPPLTDERLPQGGVIADLAMAALQEATGGREVKANWSKDRQSLIASMFEAKSAQFGAPWETPACNGLEGFGPHSAVLCDRALLSDPLFQLLYVLFIRPDSDFDLNSAEAAEGILCAPADREMPELREEQRQWIASKKLALSRPATLIDCLGMIERKEADALLVNEIEGRFTLARLGLTSTLRMGETPVATRGVHIAIPKDLPNAEATLAEINAAIARLKQTGRYGEIIGRHLSELQTASGEGN